MCVCGASVGLIKDFKKHVVARKCIVARKRGKQIKIGSTESFRIYLSDVEDPIKILYNLSKKFVKIITQLLKKNQIRMYLCAKTSLEFPSNEEEEEDDDDEDPKNWGGDYLYFRSESEHLVQLDDIKEVVHGMIDQIQSTIETHQGVGSGQRMNNTEYVSLEVAFL